MPRLALILLGVSACQPKPPTTNQPELHEAAQSRDLNAIYETLESLIDERKATERDRAFAYQEARQVGDDGSAEWAFLQASIIGRYAETRGLKALALVREVEKLAKLSLERDADFRGHAAQRMLGSLYVMAGDHLEGSDSEIGLEMLEDLVDRDPEDPLHQLRLAQGYVFLGDPDPAMEFLCFVDTKRDALRPDEQRVLDRLFTDVGGRELAGCPK